MVASVRELKHVCHNRMLSRRRPLLATSLALSPDAPTPRAGGVRVAPEGTGFVQFDEGAANSPGALWVVLPR